jgi:hypothetical protein
MDTKSGGCAIFVSIIGLGLLVAAAILANSLAGYNDTVAQRDYAYARVVEAQGQARAEVIEAEGQSRLDSAQAFAVTASASLPWAALAVAAMAGAALIVATVAIFSLALAAVSQRSRALPSPEPAWLIERPRQPALPAPPGPALLIDERVFEEIGAGRG